MMNFVLKHVDFCGEWGGNNRSMGCDGVCGSTLRIDSCGVCGGNDSALDCNGVCRPPGTADLFTCTGPDELSWLWIVAGIVFLVLFVALFSLWFHWTYKRPRQRVDSCDGDGGEDGSGGGGGEHEDKHRGGNQDSAGGSGCNGGDGSQLDGMDGSGDSSAPGFGMSLHIASQNGVIITPGHLKNCGSNHGYPDLERGWHSADKIETCGHGVPGKTNVQGDGGIKSTCDGEGSSTTNAEFQKEDKTVGKCNLISNVTKAAGTLLHYSCTFAPAQCTPKSTCHEYLDLAWEPDTHIPIPLASHLTAQVHIIGTYGLIMSKKFDALHESNPVQTAEDGADTKISDGMADLAGDESERSAGTETMMRAWVADHAETDDSNPRPGPRTRDEERPRGGKMLSDDSNLLSLSSSDT